MKHRRSGLAAACVVVLFLSAAGLAQSRPATLDIRARFVKGDRFTLEITNEKKQTGRVASTARSTVEVEVVATGAAGHVISWKILKSDVLGPDGKPVKHPTVQAAANLFTGVAFLIELSGDCGVIGLKNYDEVKALLVKATKTIVGKAPLPPEQVKQLMATLQGMYASRPLVTQLVTKEVSLYLQFGNVRLPLHKATEADVAMPMPMGGGVIRATQRVKVESVDRAKNTAVVSFHQKLDPEAARKATMAFLRKAAAQAGRPGPTERDLPKMDIADEATYVIDTKSGWPVSVDFSRRTTLGDALRVDGYKITRKPAPPRAKPATTQRAARQ